MSVFTDWILALDFDGVVWDSVDECFATAVTTYKNLFHEDCSGLEAPFRKGRWLVRGGWDFMTVLNMARENPDRDWDAVAKDYFSGRRDQEPHGKEFEAEFYRVRAEQQHDSPSAWAASQKPYEGFVAQLPALREAFREVVLTTTKDEKSAHMLLATAGIKMSVWGREHGTQKGAQITDLCSQRSLAPNKVVFIDDLMDNLEQVSPTGAHGFLAGWGYNTERERERARSAGYRVLEQENILQQLESWRTSLA